MVLCCCGNNNHQVDDPEDGAGGPEVGEGGEARGVFLYRIFLVNVIGKTHNFSPFSAERGTRHSVNKMFYSRIGRVEKFKHGSKYFYFVVYLFFGCLP